MQMILEKIDRGEKHDDLEKAINNSIKLKIES